MKILDLGQKKCLHRNITDATTVPFKYFRNGPTETASDSLKTDATKKKISQELNHISLSCKKH